MINILELKIFLEYLNDKVESCYKVETTRAIERFIEDFFEVIKMNT